MNLFDLSGRVAIVTGGNGGIGLGMARGLAAAGARVALVGRNEPKSRAAAAQLAEDSGVETLAVTADLARAEQVAPVAEAVRRRFGRIDILINNAGINILKAPEDYALEDWREVLDVNLTAAFLMAKAVYPALKEAGGGKIINIGSMTSVFGASIAPAYAASKGGIVQLTRSLALAWAPDRIGVNAILPGWFDTELTRQGRRATEDLHDRVQARIPLGRWGAPDDLAGTAIWLASPASDYVTGAAIPVDGGYTSAI